MNKQNLYWSIVLESLMGLFQEQIGVLNSHECDKQKLYLLKLNIFGAELDLKEASGKWVEEHIFTHKKAQNLPHNKERFFLPKNKVEVVFHLN